MPNPPSRRQSRTWSGPFSPSPSPSPSPNPSQVRRRGTVTGREVPEHEVLDSIQRVPQAVNQLAPLADFLAVIDNSAAAPHLVKYCDADTCFLSKADGSSEP